MRRAVGAMLVAVVSTCSQPTASPAPAASSTPAPASTAAPTPNPLPLVTLRGVLELSAPSRAVVWALANGRFLFVSIDAGATWQQRTVPGTDNETGFSFISDKEGWLTTASGTTTTLWHTVDGAASWSEVRSLTVRDGEALRGMSFVDAQRGFLTGFTAGAPPVVYRTSDGGVSWFATAGLGGAPPYVPAGPVKEFSGALLVSVGAQVYRSLDGGAYWQLFARAPGASTASVAFANSTRWGTSPTYGFETEDGGVTWQTWAGDYSQAAGVAPQVVFASTEVVYATVRGSIERSDDNGSHWSQLKTPGT